MESCAGSQWTARKVQALGHKVRLIPAQFVKPYVKSNKSDINDAEAIAEAATRPTMRFAALKSEEQADLQALHRLRDQDDRHANPPDQPNAGFLPRIGCRATAKCRPVQTRPTAGSRGSIE
uniref:IS110 family transposase n=1 Tax=Rhizobium meliloti TaxID=382 RepID=UPI001F40A06C|nr:transposase [Sinorhizobium meliloti]